MNTNDEQAERGKPKREPMLSDERIVDMTWEYDQKDGDDPAALYERGLNDARRHYENLITTGKLRVVEEVDAMCGDHGGIEGCSCSKCSAPVAPEYWMYCPGCGNKVKR